MTTKQKRVAPEGSTVLCPYLMVESVEAQIVFLIAVFNARLINDSNKKDGYIQHGEVLIGDTVVMMGRVSAAYPARQSMNYVYVENADAVYAMALQNGATGIMPPEDRSYGTREGGFADVFGNQWWIAQLLSN